MNYYLLDQNQQQIGPYSEAELRMRLTCGSLMESDWVWQENWPDWRPLGSLFKNCDRSFCGTLPIRAPAEVSNRSDASSEGAYRTSAAIEIHAKLKKIRFWPFALALVCLLLPFVNVSCKIDRRLGYSLSGVQLVTGAKVRVDDQVLNVPSMPAAVVTTLAVVIALAFAIPHDRRFRAASGGASAIGFISTVAVKVQVDGRVLREGEGMFRANYLVGFWALTLFLVVGCLMHFYLAKAPSLRNGDQS